MEVLLFRILMKKILRSLDYFISTFRTLLTQPNTARTILNYSTLGQRSMACEVIFRR